MKKIKLPNNKNKTLKVGILGEPNTGKSTLFNTLMKKKYSIVTRKAQTTIKKKSAVLVNNNKQIIIRTLYILKLSYLS